MRSTTQCTIIAMLFLLSGCGILFGNVKPDSKRSDSYQVDDLSVISSKWKKIAAPSDNDHSDLTFQSDETASIVSLNSVCRERILSEKKTLQSYSDILFLGVLSVSRRKEKKLKIDDIPALQTTLSGKLNGQEMKFRAVVLKKQGCLYDLMYISRPKNFEKEEQDFSKFLSSLRIDE